MAPEPRRNLRENAFPFEPGIKGRKTGLIIPDTGLRDENGFEPMDHLFSSPPQNATISKSASRMSGMNATFSSDEMDEGESTIPEPARVLTQRKGTSMRLPPPKSKSPMKTHLNSPARRNPSLGLMSSPVRGSVVEPKSASAATNVRRKLDFSNGSLNEEFVSTAPVPRNKRGDLANPKPGDAELTKLAPMKRVFRFTGRAEDDEGTTDQVQSDAGEENPYEIVNGDDDEDAQVEDIPREEPMEGLQSKPHQPAKKRGRRPKITAPMGEPVEATASSAPNKSKQGRPRRTDFPIEEVQELAERPVKKARRSVDIPEAVNAAITKPMKTSAQILLPQPEKAARKAKLAAVKETDSPLVQRGPPMPRRTGLVTVRRETPMDSTGFRQTRSGRNSIRPLAYWKNEKAEYSDDEVEDSAGKFLVPRIKGVVRVDEIADTRKRPKSRSKSSKSKKRQIESEEEEEAEPWEAEPGRLYGEVVIWDPDQMSGSHSEEREEELALSSAAIITQDIPGGSVRFAKTLTLPFFGSGVVDLPPGSIKKTKASRKMQLAFFVFTGRVKVIINGTEFRISKGGMFQVPRGNTYSIENDYEAAARIFFSQGCELELEDADESQRID